MAAARKASQSGLRAGQLVAAPMSSDVQGHRRYQRCRQLCLQQRQRMKNLQPLLFMALCSAPRLVCAQAPPWAQPGSANHVLRRQTYPRIWGQSSRPRRPQHPLPSCTGCQILFVARRCAHNHVGTRGNKVGRFKNVAAQIFDGLHQRRVMIIKVTSKADIYLCYI